VRHPQRKVERSHFIQYCRSRSPGRIDGHERLTRPRWAFIAAGFLGMLLIIRPGSRMLTPTSLFALGAAGLYAVFQILTRGLAGENLMVVLAYPSLVRAVGLSLAVPFIPDPGVCPMSDLFAFVGIGIVGAVGHLLFVRAFQRASASAIAPFTYMQLVWSTLAACYSGRFRTAGRCRASS
jgi:drug/metabolite transporter (DMT)-like permease